MCQGVEIPNMLLLWFPYSDASGAVLLQLVWKNAYREAALPGSYPQLLRLIILSLDLDFDPIVRIYVKGLDSSILVFLVGALPLLIEGA